MLHRFSWLLAALLLAVGSTLPSSAAPRPQTRSLPLLSTQPATNITATSVTLNAVVRARDDSAEVRFEWGRDLIYDLNVTSPVTRTGDALLPVNVPLTGLLPGTRYTYRVVATNSAGTQRGADVSFVTASAPGAVADLTVGVQNDTDGLAVGQPITYTLTVRNRGPQPASGVVLTNTLPPIARVLRTDPSAPVCTIRANEAICALGTLAAGTQRQVTLVALPSTSGLLTNIASVRASQSDPNLLNNSDQLRSSVAAVPRGTSAELLITPEQGGTLVLTATHGLTVGLTVPAGAVRKPTAIIMTDLPNGPTQPLNPNLSYVGRAFLLETFQDGVIQPEFPLLRAATLRVAYRTSLYDEATGEDALLRLYRLSSAALSTELAWRDTALRGNTRVVSATGLIDVRIDHLAEHALVFRPRTPEVGDALLFLPLVQRGGR